MGTVTLTASKVGTADKTISITVTDAVITKIAVTPSSADVAKGKTLQLMAMATYSDTSTNDVTDSVTWVLTNTATATVIPGNLLSGTQAGTTILTAKKDNIESDGLDVNVCDDLAGACIDLFKTANGKLYTNSPSVAYVNKVGGIQTNGSYSEDGTYGPDGSFARFNLDNANALCATYNTHKLGGKSNWRLATKDELKTELFYTHGKMFAKRGWPTDEFYWSSTPYSAGYNNVIGLNTGYPGFSLTTTSLNASCVSEP